MNSTWLSTGQGRNRAGNWLSRTCSGQPNGAPISSMGARTTASSGR